MEEFIIRENPQIKIVLFNDRLELHERDKEKTEYVLKEIDSFQIGKRVNWVVSILSFIVGVFTETSGDVYKERDKLKFNYEGKLIVISLKGGDQGIAMTAANRINQFIREAYKTK
jgi:hypothetical protein